MFLFTSHGAVLVYDITDEDSFQKVTCHVIHSLLLETKMHYCEFR